MKTICPIQVGFGWAMPIFFSVLPVPNQLIRNGHVITSLFGAQIGCVLVRSDWTKVQEQWFYFELLWLKNGRRRAEADDGMDAGGRATQETKPRCQTGKLLRAHSLPATKEVYQPEAALWKTMIYPWRLRFRSNSPRKGTVLGCRNKGLLLNSGFLFLTQASLS